MATWSNYFLKVMFMCLAANTVLFFLNLVRELTTERHPTMQDQHCCSQICNEHDQKNERPWQRMEVNYTELMHKMPSLDPSYHKTLVRLGSDLDFDLSQCPNHSLMLHTKRDFIPKHLDCPTLYLIGARKAGTSSLYHYICKHPEFRGTKMDAGPKVGETFYFGGLYGKKSWQQYLSLFPKGGVMTGEASVGNLVNHLVPKRLYEFCWKQAKVVMLFRDPVTRFQSNFLMRSRLERGGIYNESSISLYLRTQLSQYFQKSLHRTMNMKQTVKDWNKFVGLFRPAQNLVYEGLYYVHLLNWLCNFPAENILIINSEEFYQNSNYILDIVFQFLDLKRLDFETYKWITSTNYNKGKYTNIPTSQKLSSLDKVTLMGAYRPFNKALLELLKWDTVKWVH